MGLAPYRRRRKHETVDISAAIARPAGEVNGPLWPRGFNMGWSGSHEEHPVEPQRKQAIELCDVPEQPFWRYFTPIVYDDKQVGAIRLTRGAWRATIHDHEYGPFKTFLGARKFVYQWYSGLDIDPGDASDL